MQSVDAIDVSLPFGGKQRYDWDEAANQIARWNTKWDDGDPTNGSGFGTPGVASIAFLDSGKGGDTHGLDALQLAMGMLAIEEIASVANIEFDVIDAKLEGDAAPPDPDIEVMMMSGTNGGVAYVSRSGGEIFDASVQVGSIGLFHSLKGFNYRVFLHELLHAVGLAHPGSYNGSDAAGYANGAEYFEDSWQYSVMSYWDETNTGAVNRTIIDGRTVGSFATGLQMHDIAALQLIYGVNGETRTGDDIYGFNSNIDHDAWSLNAWHEAMVAAIWDAGGEDTIDGSLYYVDSTYDLREEAFSSTGGLTNNLSIARGVKIENAIGGSGDDMFIGNAQDDSHTDAAEGSETGYAGDNVLDGRGGVDTVDFTSALAVDETGRGVTIDLTLKTAQDNGANGADTLISIENLIGSHFDDTLSGGQGANELLGGIGDDQLRGRGGADQLNGGLGVDWALYDDSALGVRIDLSIGLGTGGDATGDVIRGIENVLGSAADDVLIGDTGANELVGGAGGDDLSGGLGHDQLTGGAGNDRLAGGWGFDRIDGGDGDDLIYFDVNTTDRVLVNLFDGWARDGHGHRDVLIDVEGAIGGDGGDLLLGDAAANALFGRGGRDFLIGREGDDTLSGGDGNDVLNGNQGDDTLSGGAGDDALAGGWGEDVLSGGDGADLLIGQQNADDISGGAGDDRLSGDAGRDTLSGDAGDDRLHGGAGRDVLLGGDGDDRLYGDGGADRLDGGAGDDLMIGGDGADIFVFSAGRDLIRAFHHGRDQIELQAGVDFDDLTLSDGADGLEISDGVNVLVIANSATDRIDADDFIFTS